MDNDDDTADTSTGKNETVAEMDTNPDMIQDTDGLLPGVERRDDDTDVVMSQDVHVGRKMGVDADDSDGDSDNNENLDEEEEDEDEEDPGEFTKQSKTGGKRASQTVNDSLFDSFSFTGGGSSNVENTESVKFLSAETQRWVDRGVCNTAHVNTQRKFVCFKFPGLIQNKDKAIACLGGVNNIMEAVTVSKIDLVFRPDDPYSKPVVGMYKKNNHILVRCRRRRKVIGDDQPSTSASGTGHEVGDGFEYKVEVLGIIQGIFTFERPCDFQYLPVVKKTDGDDGYRELLSDLVVKFEDERQGFMNRDVPLYLPPYVFSRSERPAKYLFQDDDTSEEKPIGMARKIRNMGTQRVTYASNEVPQGPNKYAMAIFEPSNSSLEPLKEIFKQRPLWSMVGLMAQLRAVDNVYLRKFVNMVAYSFSTGPWIHLWCKFGYDPRQNKESKMYQTIDFRIRKRYNRERVTAKRDSMSQQVGRRGFTTYQGHKLPEMDKMATAQGSGGVQSPVKEQAIDVFYQFSPNLKPPYRQMYYQVCDVMMDEVQRLVHLNDGKETTCTEKDGWCISDFLVMSRDILARHSEKLLWTTPEAETETAVEEGVV